MSKRGKGKDDPPTVYQTEDGGLDLDAIAADISRFEIAAGLHGRDTGGFTAWHDLGVMDEEALIAALIRNRHAALNWLKLSGFEPPEDVQGAALDPGKARRLAFLADRQFRRRRKLAKAERDPWAIFIMNMLLNRMAADILDDWATFRENATTFPSWQRDAAMVRILGRGATFVFYSRDAIEVVDAIKKVMRAEQERAWKSDGGARGGEEAAKARKKRAQEDEDRIRAAYASMSPDTREGVKVATIKRLTGFSESKVRRAVRKNRVAKEAP